MPVCLHINMYCEYVHGAEKHIANSTALFTVSIGISEHSIAAFQGLQGVPSQHPGQEQQTEQGYHHLSCQHRA